MGRGLSPLQRRILQLAHDNREAGRSKRGTADVYTAEVFAMVYGFPTLPGADVRDPSRQTFSREEIGTKAYDTAAAAVSRALRRLEERGLLTRQGGAGAGAGARLTKAGRQEAATLAAASTTPT
ncbi:winged-helix domain-containing protein [Streptomyces sp. NPDC127091]|uniref:winged-helix domain-containing protein n=1 Tax=Streptomyces sp. NPDC127091 TaxID=3347134 RepID=UPI003650A578